MDEVISLLLVIVVAATVFLRPRIGLYLMVLLTPVQYYVVLSSGATLIRYLGWIVLVAWLSQKLVTKARFGPLFVNPLVLPTFLLLYLCLISFIWSDDTTWETTFFTYLQLIIWVIMIIDLIDSRQRLETLLTLLALGSLISAVIMISEFLTQHSTWEYATIAEGGFGDRNMSAASFLFVLPFLSYWFRSKGAVRQIITMLAFATSVIAIVVSTSRTGLLILPIVLLLLFTSSTWTAKKPKHMVLLLIIAATLPFWPWDRLGYRWSNEQTQGLGGRVEVWTATVNEILKAPLTGRGLGSYRDQYTVATHNLFLEIASQLGVFGLLLFGWIWITTWQQLLRSRHHAQNLENMAMYNLISAIQISLIVYFIFSMTLSTQTDRMLWLTFALAGACQKIVLHTTTTNEVFENIGRGEWRQLGR